VKKLAVVVVLGVVAAVTVWWDTMASQPPPVACVPRHGVSSNRAIRAARAAAAVVGVRCRFIREFGHEPRFRYASLEGSPDPASQALRLAGDIRGVLARR